MWVERVEVFDQFMHVTAAGFITENLVCRLFLLQSVSVGTDLWWFSIMAAVWGYDKDGRQVCEGTLFKNPCAVSRPADHSC